MGGIVLEEPLAVAEDPLLEKSVWRDMGGRLGPGQPAGWGGVGAILWNARLLGGRDMVCFEFGNDTLEAERGVDRTGWGCRGERRKFFWALLLHL